MKNYLWWAAFVGAICFSLFVPKSNKKTNQDIIAEYVQNRFVEIDQHRTGGRKLSLDEAEAYLYCWAFDGGFKSVSQEELKEAIAVVLECNEEIQALVYEIDDIDLDDYK